MSEIRFYNSAIDLELQKIGEVCDYYRLRVKEITSDIYEKTTWVEQEIQDFQREIIRSTYLEYCEAMSERIIFHVGPVAYRKAAEKNDLIEYVKKQFFEYAIQYKAYCEAAISPKDSLYDTKKLLSETIKKAVYEPWRKASKKAWRERAPIILGTAISALAGWLLNEYGKQLFDLIKN